MKETPRPTWTREEIIEPDLPIVDPHHHLWAARNYGGPGMPAIQHAFEHVGRWTPRYLLDELLADTGSGHNIAATIFIECRAMYRATGPDEFKVLGETEFVNGVAAMSASGLFGKTKACAGIVSHVDLMLGARAGEVLDRHMGLAPDRFRGIRHSASYDADKGVLGPLAGRPPHLFLDKTFRQGFAELSKRNLSFEAWLLEPQLPDLIDLARAFPGQRIVLDHVGTPLGLSSYEGKLPERFGIWRKNIEELAKSPNVFVKLGGLAMPFCNFPSTLASPPAPSAQLAQEWRPYIETCIEAFGPKRSMFESNFPVDLLSASYDRLWNAMKIIAKGASADDKANLFFTTANRFYRLGL